MRLSKLIDQLTAAKRPDFDPIVYVRTSSGDLHFVDCVTFCQNSVGMDDIELRELLDEPDSSRSGYVEP